MIMETYRLLVPGHCPLSLFSVCVSVRLSGRLCLLPREERLLLLLLNHPGQQISHRFNTHTHTHTHTQTVITDQLSLSLYLHACLYVSIYPSFSGNPIKSPSIISLSLSL